MYCRSGRCSRHATPSDPRVVKIQRRQHSPDSPFLVRPCRVTLRTGVARIFSAGWLLMLSVPRDALRATAAWSRATFSTRPNAAAQPTHVAAVPLLIDLLNHTGQIDSA